MPEPTPYPFETATELREAHSRLLRALEERFHAGGEDEEAAALVDIEPEIREFLERAAGTGTFLDDIADRTECQVLVDYWVSALSRAGLRTSGVRLARFDEIQLPDLKDKPCPYVGLEAFRSADFFFGREADTQTLLMQVRAMPLVVVLGASGSGKSSIVLGGVLPVLAADVAASHWRVLPTFVPGTAVLESLVEAVLPALGTPDQAAAVAAAARIRADPSHLGALAGGPDAPPTVIVIDQFEEVFTLSTPADREACVAALVDFLGARSGHRVILTMREEFRSKMVELTALDLLLSDNRAWYSMRPMGYEELRAAVEKPAALVNLHFQKGILDDLVKKVLGQPAALPLLQFTLRELWRKRNRNRITWDVYRAVGDPLTALQSTADAFYLGQAPQSQDEVRRILLALVRVDELLEAYRQPVRKSALIAAGKANTDDVLDLLAAGEYVRIARRPEGAEAIVEIRHESLIRNWPRFVGWIDDKRRDRRQRFALAQAAETWAKGGRPRAGLLTGWQMQQAAEQSDLSGVEREFIEASTTALRRVQLRNQRLLVGSGVLVLLLLGISFWAFDTFYLQDRRATWGELDAIVKLPRDEKIASAEKRLDGIALYLWGKRVSNPGALDQLVQILSAADQADLFQRDIYKVNEWNIAADTITSMTADTPTIVTLEYPSGTAVSKPLLQQFWREFSKSMWQVGFPIPPGVTVSVRDGENSRYRVTIVRLERPTGNADHPQAIAKTVSSSKLASKRTGASETSQQSAQLTRPGQATQRGQSARQANAAKAELAPEFLETTDSQDFDFTFDSSQVLLLVSDTDFDPAAKTLLYQYRTEWHVTQAFKDLGLKNWWWVPRWTIPIWKAARGIEFHTPETGAVVYAMMQIQQKPKLLYSDGFIAGILFRQAESTPETVRAACLSAGGMPALIDKAKAGFASNLSVSLLGDLLEDIPRNAPRVMPATDACNFSRIWKAISESHDTAFFAQELDTAVKGANKPAAPLRVSIAPNLRLFVAPDGTHLDDNLVARLDQQVRAAVRRSVGYYVPAVTFSVNYALDADQYTIEIYGKNLSPIQTVARNHEIDDMLQGLQARLWTTRALWLNVEEVAALTRNLPVPLREWLAKNYNVGQLRAILQGALGDNPTTVENKLTLVHLAWLVRSLAFWKQECADLDLQCLSAGLRATEQARLHHLADAVRTAPPAFPGLAPLVADRLDEAAAPFTARLRGTDHTAASSAFVDAYAPLAVQMDYKLVEGCAPEVGRYKDSPAYADGADGLIDALLGENGPALTDSMQRRLELCRTLGRLSQTTEQAHVREYVDRQLATDTSHWDAREKYWLGYLALRAHFDSEEARDKAPPRHLTEIRTLLAQSIRALPTVSAEAGFEELIPFCDKPAAGAWCVRSFADWPQLKPDSYWIAVELAYRLTQLGRDDNYTALQLLEGAARNLARLPTDKRPQQKAWVALERGYAHESLDEFGVAGALEAAIRDVSASTAVFRALPHSELESWSDLIDQSLTLLASALQSKGDIKGAHDTIELGYSLIQHRNYLEGEDVFLLWSEGKFKETLKLIADRKGDSWTMLRCWLRLYVEETPDAKRLDAEVGDFLQSSLESRDYVRLAYGWHLMRIGEEGRALQLLQARWHEINPSDAVEPPSWAARLTPERGDYMAVWHEMLIGYFLGKIPPQRISALLDNEREFAASPWAAAPQSLDGFRTEWHFYDALLQSVSGDASTRVARFRSGLERTLDEREVRFNEYAFAKLLLGRLEQPVKPGAASPHMRPAH